MATSLIFRLCFLIIFKGAMTSADLKVYVQQLIIPVLENLDVTDDEHYNLGSAEGNLGRTNEIHNGTGYAQIPNIFAEEIELLGSGVDPRSFHPAIQNHTQFFERNDSETDIQFSGSASEVDPRSYHDANDLTEIEILGSGVDPRSFHPTIQNHTQFFERNDSETDIQFSGSASEVDPRSYHDYISQSLWHVGRQNTQQVCIANVKRADVIFIVDVGRNLARTALPNLMEFVMSTLLVMELGEDQIRVGIVSMGSDSSSIGSGFAAVSEVLSLSKGINHRSVQDSLDKFLVKGDQEFDFARCLDEVQKILGDNPPDTVMVISVFSAPIVQSRVVDALMRRMQLIISDLTFFHVSLSTTIIEIGRENEPKEENAPDVRIIPEYAGKQFLSRASGVANEIVKSYGCDYCRPNPCPFGSVCILTSDFFQCACPSGFVSGVCEPCLENPCNGSRCLPTGTSYVCDPCEPSPCQNGGKCFYSNDRHSAFCECTENTLGDFCDLICPECPPESTCKNINGKAVCECFEGFFGPTCSRNCDVMITCVNNGTCDFDENQNPICNCIGDFHGPRCENLCDELTCQNGGSCGVSNSERMCYCLPKFDGKFCEIDKCDSYFSCKNGGRCGVNFNTNQLECQCVPPFTGVTCGINPCDNYSCHHGGSCRLNNNLDPVCDCVPPFSGPRCLNDPCSSEPCQNGGTCLIESSSFSCNCSPGYWGRTCEFHPCKPDPCFNGGTCLALPPVTNPFLYECLCTEFYTGDRCLVEIASTTSPAIPIIATSTTTTGLSDDVCDPNPCSFPCECKPSCKHSDGFVCVSSDGKLGKTCSIGAPDLECGSHAITITVDRQYLIEMLGRNVDRGYFMLGWNENDGSSVFCKSVEVTTDQGDDVHKLVVPAPFTACGTDTAMNEQKVLSISNKIWFNINSTIFDLLTPVFTWYCNYTTQYTATTSLVPEIYNHNGTLTELHKKNLSINMQTCKLTTQCASTCPSHLVESPGAVYAVGQLINVIVHRVTVAGETLRLIDFYLSCGRNPNSTVIIPITNDGCPTGVLQSTVSFRDGSTCIMFQLPKLRDCNIIFIHAKLGICEATEACGTATVGIRCLTSPRRRRSISREELHGPFYTWSVDGETFWPQSYHKSQDLQDLDTETKKIEDSNFETGSYVILAPMIVVALLFCFLVFMYLNVTSRRYSLQL